jgi:hypothetical protein
VIFVSTTPGVPSTAGVGISGNSTFMGPDPTSQNFQDSKYLPVYGKLTIGFSTPDSIPNTITFPNNNQPTKIQPGNYLMYISIFGYDISGNTVFKSYYIGTVKVTS